MLWRPSRGPRAQLARLAALALALALALLAPAMAARHALALDGEAAAAAAPPPAVVSREVQLLSRHSTVARLAGVQQRPCMFRTSECPDRCGHGGAVAVFDVVRYLAYEKAPESPYGDQQQQRHHVRLGAGDAGSERQELAGLDEAIRALPAGALVRLDWQHNYVSTTWAGGGVGKGPERPVTRLEAFADEAAAAAATA